MTDVFENLQGGLWVGAAFLLGVIVHFLVFKISGHFVRQSENFLAKTILKQLRAPSRLMIPLFFINLSFPLIMFPERMLSVFKQTFAVFLILAIGWLIIRAIYIFEEVILSHFQMTVSDNLRARKITTQVQILKKVAISLVGFLSLVAILMTFERIRYLGTSMLASAGVAGIIIGFAAQRSIATLLAGIQVAITQPIRIDDVLIVENEWGRVEEITLTYVVIKIWDERRLIIPISHFIENPFQNWTRSSAQLLGTVFIHLDYKAPVADIRHHLKELLSSSKDWDGRVCVLQVTNATENTMELRALMSAKDSSAAWNLRCFVREKLIEYCQEHCPHALPRHRAELDNTSTTAS